MAESTPVFSEPRYFRFPDAATGMAALEAAGLLLAGREGGKHFVTASSLHALDVIGPISYGGEYDSETGAELVAPTTLPGWHVNYIGEIPDGWEQYAVTPENPVRRWL